MAKKIKPANQKCDNSCGNIAVRWSSGAQKWVCHLGKQCPGVKENRRKTLRLKYGVDNISQSRIIKDKKKNTLLSNYGVDHQSKSSIVKEKKKQTCQRNYGVDNPGESSTIQERMRETRLSRYNVDHHMQLEFFKDKVFSSFERRTGYAYPSQDPRVRMLMEETSIKNCGAPYRLQSQEGMAAHIETILEKYGVENPSQCPEVQEKKVRNSFRSKDYILPSGKEIKIQGYESEALDWLFSCNLIKEEDILFGKSVPSFYYEYGGKKRRYFPDFYVIPLNMIIEVKSPWTFDRYKLTNLAKKEQVIKEGYSFSFIIIDKKKNISLR